FALKRGTATWLSGPNGIGKSTLLRCLAGAEPLNSGTVKIGGFSLEQQPKQAKRRIGLALDEPFLLPYLTAVEHIHFWVGLSGGGSRDVLRGLAMLQELTVQKVQDRQIRNYSRGQRQQLGLVGAMLSSPEVLLLDEPGTATDAENKLVYRDFLSAYLLSGGAALFTSHDPELVRSWATDEFNLAEALTRQTAAHSMARS
ncbi:MAG: ABC transporter ATP-binding protein, partial [Angustibacter sp.]